MMTVATDRIDIGRARLLQTILPEPRLLADDAPLPDLSHWLFFPPAAHLAELGTDGHPRPGAKPGGFLPDTGLPRRMWAGSRLVFVKPLFDGMRVERRSALKSVTPKEGKSGRLCFVTVEHLVTADGEICLREEQDIVYREAAKTTPQAAPKRLEAPAKAAFSETILPDPVMLFRYSALTFNAHRIHYDRDYATTVEGHRGLVVHGPLLATLLFDLFERKSGGRRAAFYSFKAVSPLYDGEPFRICGRIDDDTATLWAEAGDGALAMQAEVRCR